MNRRGKQRRINIILTFAIAIMLISLVGTTFAFYTSTNTVNNMLITKGSEVFIQEYFSPEDMWVAGETKAKQVWFGNQDEGAQVIRFTVETQWYQQQLTRLTLPPTGFTPWIIQGTYDPEPVVINYTSAIIGPSATWTKIGDYYYYNQVLEGRDLLGQPATTAPVIDSVTFSQAISNNGYAGDDFSDKVCRITIKMESLNVVSAITEDTWHARFTQTGSALTWNTAP